MARGRLSEVSKEIMRLAGEFGRNPVSQDVRDRWQEVWRETVGGDGLNGTDIDTAWDVLFLGWRIAMHDGHFRAAADLVSRYLKHPDIGEADELRGVVPHHWLADSLLHAGDEAGALTALHSLIEREYPRRGDGRGALYIAWRTLLEVCSKQGAAEQASEEFTELAREIDHRLRRRKVRRWQPGGATYAELRGLLLSTLPAEVREKWERNGT
jgi:hypothetical protein